MTQSKQEKAIAIQKKYDKQRLVSLKEGLHDADRRFQIGVGRMQAIGDRVHELESERNQLLRKEFLVNKLKEDPKNIKIKNEIKKIGWVNEGASDTYKDVAIGYRSMSTRKNSLEEERNHYVADIEKQEMKIKNG